MTLPRTLLILGALIFIALGLGFLLIPVQWAAVVDIALPTPMARTDLRATYGGFDVGIGVYLALCARRADWHRPGLVAFTLAAAGFGTGRLIGILVEGSATPLMLLFLAIEALSTAVGIWALRRMPSK